MPAAPLPSYDDFMRLSAEQRVLAVRSMRRGTCSVSEGARIVLTLGRPRTCVAGALAFMLGIAYTGEAPTLRVAIAATLCFFGGFVANLGNSYTDLTEDSHNLPARLYLVGRVGHRTFFEILIGFYVVMLTIAAAFGWVAFVAMAICLIVVHEYSFPPLQAKRRPLLGIVVFALVVVFPFLVSTLARPGAPFLRAIVTGAPTVEVGHQVQRFLAMTGFLLLWFVAKGAFKNVPDYEGDQAAGLRTSATIFASRRRAAGFATALTLLAYAMLLPIVLAGLERPLVLIALLWLPLVIWNCGRLIRAEDTAQANAHLKTDMLISSGFIATLLLLLAPTIDSIIALGAGALVIVMSDALQVDSRSAQCVPTGLEQRG